MGPIKKIQEMKYDMTRWRQKLHSEPELSAEERTTCRFITRTLQSFGIEAHTVGKTGVVGVLHGKRGAVPADKGGKAIMLRADIDALPIADETGAVHASRTEGVHHASGHDGHIAMLLGAAKYLSQTQEFDGTVYFLFQPASEDLGGAQDMIKEGLFEKFPCDEVYAMRNDPDLTLGTLLTKVGPHLTGSEEFFVTFRGKGGHAAHAAGATNLMGALAEAITSMQAMAQREIADNVQASLVIASIHTNNDVDNVLPSAVALQGSVRSFDPELKDKLRHSVNDIAQLVADRFGASVTVDYKNENPAIVNGEEQTQLALEAAKEIVGEAKTAIAAKGDMNADDFAHLMQEKPGNMITIGTGKADGKPSPALHSAKYDFNDAALPIGASYWAKLVEKALPAKKAPKPKA